VAAGVAAEVDGLDEGGVDVKAQNAVYRGVSEEGAVA
jgi:hypothetical protein